MAENEVQVQPDKKGGWFVTEVVDGRGKKGDSFDVRSEAVEAARETADGECRVVLMREDGSEFAELDAPPSEAEATQQIDLEPAGETGEAG